MRTLPLYIIALLLVAGLGKLGAQDTTPPPIPAPAPVPESAVWTMKLVMENASPQSAMALRYTKTGLTWQVETLTKGAPQVYWRWGGYLVEPVQDARLPLVLSADAAISSQPFYSKAFYGTDWIKPEFYKGKVSLKGTECYYFQGPAPRASSPAPGNEFQPAPPSAGGSGTTASEAWLDSKTLLPVGVRINGVLFEYSFEPAPAAPLTLPPACQEAVDLYKARQARLKALLMK